jgi:16S rRNA (guanine527-N7)-methyltransferase
VISKPSVALLLLLKEGLLAQGLSLSEDIQEKLIGYVELLHKWNAVHNLTAITEPTEMITRHILDSLTVFPFLAKSEVKTILDVGTGAGLPGIVLALCFPGCSFVLLDSQQKKINFVQHVVLSLKLKNVSPICERVENYKPNFKFDWVISRAYASLSNFVSSASHLCGDQGRMIAMKGNITLEEKTEIPKTYEVERCETLNVPGLSAYRCLVFLKKGEMGA